MDNWDNFASETSDELRMAWEAEERMDELERQRNANLCQLQRLVFGLGEQ